MRESNVQNNKISSKVFCVITHHYFNTEQFNEIFSTGTWRFPTGKFVVVTSSKTV